MTLTRLKVWLSGLEYVYNRGCALYFMLTKPLFPLPCDQDDSYLHCTWDICLCNTKQTSTHWIWLFIVTLFNSLLLFSCPAGVKSVDDTTVLGKLDTKCYGQYVGGKQLNSLYYKRYEHRCSKHTQCWQMLYNQTSYRKWIEWFWQDSKGRYSLRRSQASNVLCLQHLRFCLQRQFISVVCYATCRWGWPSWRDFCSCWPCWEVAGPWCCPKIAPRWPGNHPISQCTLS